jgi:hypothetical protein
MSLSIKDLYWVAGFLEGEGTFYYNVGRLIIQAPQVQREPLEKLQKILGGNISNRTRYAELNRSPIYVWYIGGSKAAGAMMTLFPLMSPKRKIQISGALTLWKTRPGRMWKGYRTHCINGHKWTPKNTKYKKCGTKKYRCCITCYNNTRTHTKKRLKEAKCK